MTSRINGNGQIVVTWKQVATILLPLMLAPITISLAIISHHERRPHDQAARQKDLDLIRDDLREMRQEIRDLRRLPSGE